MKSPFPGLDPYLEEYWSNVHTSMMTYIRDQMQGSLPEGLWAKVEESVTIDDPDVGKLIQAYPDVHVTDTRPWEPAWNKEVGGLAVAEPFVIANDEPLTARHIEIVDTKSGNAIVTAVEVISPSNKVGYTQRHEYQSKRQRFVRAGVNLVEIDLVRAGSYNLSAPIEKVPEDKLDGYLISVFRVFAAPSEWELYFPTLREPLPAFRIPLRPHDDDIALDLQAVMDQCYRNGSYHLGIDYAKAPKPNVKENDRDWLDSLLREQGIRN